MDNSRSNIITLIKISYISGNFTFYTLPLSAIKFQGFKEPFVLCLSPPLPLLCYCVWLSYLQIFLYKKSFFLSQKTRTFYKNSPLPLFPHQKNLPPFLNRGKRNRMRMKMTKSLCHLELRSSTNKRAPPPIFPTKHRI
jgi:hypothetical protein